MTIKIPRPDDPDLAKLWDEAKRAVINRSSLDCEHANEVPHRCKCSSECPCRREMCRIANDDCCVGDRSRCRCQPRAGWSDDDVEREKWMAVWSSDE